MLLPLTKINVKQEFEGKQIVDNLSVHKSPYVSNNC